MLGLVLERDGGTTYASQLRDFVIRPLRLDHTTLPTSDHALPTEATGGQYGLGLMPTGAERYPIETTCGRAWGHGGNVPGYSDVPISSADGSRQAVLMVNADPTLMTQAQMAQMYKLLATAYCGGVPS